MSVLDWLLFGLYMAGVLGIGLYFFRRNRSAEDYYVGGRSVGAAHVGLSVVATDVGGGFSIGLGGGSLTVLLQLGVLPLPAALADLGLDPSCYGLGLSGLLLVGVSLLAPRRQGWYSSAPMSWAAP